MSFVSVIIPSYNSGLTIEGCLSSVLQQDYPREKYEVIVIDDGSSDESDKLILKYPVMLLMQKHSGPGAARNKGLRYAKGEIIIFLDSDCTVDVDWISTHVQAHGNQSRTKPVGCIGGAIKPSLNDTNFIELCDYYSSWYSPPRVHKGKEYEYLPSTNLSMRKKVMDEMGGFEESLWCGEDIALGMKLREFGYSIIHNPSILCYHRNRRTIKTYLYHHYNWGEFAPSFRKFGSKARYDFLFPPNIILAVLFSPIISIGYTGYVVMKWFLKKPFLIVLLTPAIFISKIAYACGCIKGTIRLVRQ